MPEADAQITSVRCISEQIGDNLLCTFYIPVKDVLSISYVAVRGRDKEDGAVQRVLNRRRINAIRDFILKGNGFVNLFVLNWTATTRPIQEEQRIEIPLLAKSAQILDGQHRLEGYRAAIRTRPELGEEKILVSLSVNLTTEKAADIFLNINTEQKPVPKSLLYDLFALVDDDGSHAVNRAKDIAEFLNTTPDSPYFELIKFPGEKRRVGTIALSTVIDALKKLVGPDGALTTVNLSTLDFQQRILLNYFSAIQREYKRAHLWGKSKANPFLTGAGFNGAIDAFIDTFLAKCVDKKSFTEDSFVELLGLSTTRLLKRDEIKSLGGREGRRRVKDFLELNIKSEVPTQDEYEI